MANIHCMFACMLSALCIAAAERRHTVLILVGGTGDLAARYLWDGIFKVYLKGLDGSTDRLGKDLATNHTFDFLAAGRTAQDQGNIILNSVLKSSIKCPKEASYNSFCEKKATEFINKVMYLSLKEEADFSILCTEIQDLFSHTSADVKRELILYLAIAPAAYESVVEKFHNRCTYKVRALDAIIKVAVEKPFGLDKTSAETMSEKILSFFDEKEIYRVDHYLGKSMVKAILPFRYVPHNRAYFRISSRSFSEVEIWLYYLLKMCFYRF